MPYSTYVGHKALGLSIRIDVGTLCVSIGVPGPKHLAGVIHIIHSLSISSNRAVFCIGLASWHQEGAWLLSNSSYGDKHIFDPPPPRPSYSWPQKSMLGGSGSGTAYCLLVDSLGVPRGGKMRSRASARFEKRSVCTSYISCMLMRSISI